MIALSLSAGDAFLPDPASYDDLFYKVVEAGDTLHKFRAAYHLSDNSSLETLLSVNRHYVALLNGGDAKGQNGSAAGKDKGKGGSAGLGRGLGRSANLSAREVSRVIKQGYDTLSIEAKEGLDRWERFREGDRKALMKKIARTVVEDARGLLREGM